MTMEGAANPGSSDRTSGSATPERHTGRVQVWDPFVRVFHWLVVAGFVVNYFELVRSGKLPHQFIGYGVLALVAARILWGLVGSHRARFADFVRGPAAVRRHLGDILAHRDRRYLGHKSLETTVGFYTGAETEAAFRHFDDQVLSPRRKPASTPVKKGRCG